MAQTILGIDIGSFSVKVVQLTRLLRDFELVAYHEQIINQSSRLTHEESVAASLRMLIEKNNLASDIISVNLPSHLLSYRVIELPFSNVKKIEQTIEFELESYIPLSLEELLVDYHILSLEGNRSMVLSAYVPRSRFIKYLDMLQVSGVDPKYVGVDGIDLSHIAQIAMIPQNVVYALIDIGHQKTNICVMNGLKLQYVRTITIGGLHFTRAIQKVYQLNFEKAEALKLERGRVSFRNEDLDQISLLCQRVAEELVIAIRQTYLGYKQLYKDDDWSAIYFSGGGARLQGLSDMISSTLHLNAGNLTFLDFISHHLESPTLPEEVMAPALAQTIRVIFSNKAININFRRGEFGYQRDFKAVGGEIRQIGLWFSMIITLGLSHFLFSYYTLNKQIDQMNAELVEAAVKALPELKTQTKKSAKNILTVINSKIGEIQPQLEALRGGSGGGNTPLAILLEISRRMPDKEGLTVDVDDYSFTEEFVRIDGRTVSFEAVDKIKNALSGSEYFKNVNTRNVIKGIRDEIKFSITMEVVGQEKSEG